MVQNLGTAITAVGVLLAVLSLRAAHRQRRRQFETLYVQRYWDLMDGLSLAALAGASDDVGEDDQKIALAYFRLCEDQLELRQQGWISTETWEIWSAGIRALLRRSPFRPVWDALPLDRSDRGLSKTQDFALLQIFLTVGDPNSVDPQRALPRSTRLRRVVLGAP